ncbi:MAG TPA: FHA domain-containing protein [Tepidisphaeraceae bacterium]|nr:FHA domain-containing protein [Tepidisphaeraceae bacterium]
MPGEKIQIQWDDLKSRKVDQRLREQEALERNRRQADGQLLSDGFESTAAPSSSLWYNAILTMAIFGLLGGVLAWCAGEALRLRPDPKAEARAHMREIGYFTQRVAEGKMTAAEADSTINVLRAPYGSNPYFAIYSDTSLSDAEKDAQLRALDQREAWKAFIAKLLSFGLSGMLIALCLSIAEPVVDHNVQGAVVNGAVGAAAGLMGGLIVSLFVDRLYAALRGAGSGGGGDETGYQQMLARAITWGVLGLFLTLAPGLVMRNAKKFFIGMAGGLLGGLVGGALFDPVAAATDGNQHVSRLVALLAIGVVAGAATGLIENAAKSGWLKVTVGLIAGKQFILYRNPTFIGSGPECQIYLFRDPKVGRRHAAVHIVPGGFELENLPMGGTTLINDKPVERARLRCGDRIQIGATSLAFQEKEQTNAE